MSGNAFFIKSTSPWSLLIRITPNETKPDWMVLEVTTFRVIPKGSIPIIDLGQPGGSEKILTQLTLIAGSDPTGRIWFDQLLSEVVRRGTFGAKIANLVTELPSPLKPIDSVNFSEAVIESARKFLSK